MVGRGWAVDAAAVAALVVASVHGDRELDTLEAHQVLADFLVVAGVELPVLDGSEEVVERVEGASFVERSVVSDSGGSWVVHLSIVSWASSVSCSGSVVSHTAWLARVSVADTAAWHPSIRIRILPHCGKSVEVLVVSMEGTQAHCALEVPCFRSRSDAGDWLPHHRGARASWHRDPRRVS